VLVAHDAIFLVIFKFQHVSMLHIKPITVSQLLTYDSSITAHRCHSEVKYCNKIVTAAELEL
jgi:hypothetical protein